MIGTMTLTGLAKQLDGQLLGADAAFRKLSTDTRLIGPGDAYLALVGERFDGNDFVAQAAESGAAAAIVSRDAESNLPLLKVADTHMALAGIARENRLRSEAKVIALTGSQGKTTVKEMLAAILQLDASTLYTQANLNNTIGVPLTLLQLESTHRYAVLEMGANASGEIAFSVAAALPHIALITNASDAHIEGFGSLQGIVRAKGEILDTLGVEGTAILNADDPNVNDWITRAGESNIVLFSFANERGQSAYFARQVTLAENGRVSFMLHSPLGEVEINLQMLGKHNVFNAVAAAAAAIEAGASLSAVQKGLSSVAPVSGRLNPVRGVRGSLLIDDSYNASPSSFRAAIDVLMTCRGQKVLLAGDMKELGPDEASAHAEVGSYARLVGVEKLLAVGELSRETVAAFGEGATHFATQEQLINACEAMAGDQMTFLVKGSRGAKMDIVVDALSEKGDN